MSEASLASAQRVAVDRHEQVVSSTVAGALNDLGKSFASSLW